MRCFFFAGVALALVSIVGCGPPSKPASEKANTVKATLTKGAEVHLVLLRPIEAGGSREGLIVPFMVSEDVKDSSGNVLIPKGAVAEGEVAWSRSEGTLSGLMQRPARLAIKLRHTRAAGSETVLLCADLVKPDEPFQFTRENTSRPWEREDLNKMDSALNATVAKALSEFMETGDPSRLSADTQAKDWIVGVSKEPGMEAVRAYVDPEAPQKGQASELERVVRHVRDGSITNLAGGEVMLAVTALQEFGRLAQSVEHSLSSKLKGRTIKAYIGTPVKAYVAREISVSATR